MAPVSSRWQWSSSTRFVLVCTASVIGLSSFWRLPFLVSSHGGGAFVLIYVLAVLTLGLPLLSGQLLLARGTRTDIPGVMARWTRQAAHAGVSGWFGALAVAGATRFLACYSVIAGWSMAYGLRSVAGLLGQVDADTARTQFYAFARNTETGFGWQLIFIGLVVATGASGLRRSIEPVMRTLVLVILCGFVVLLVAALAQPDAGVVARTLFVPDFRAVTWRGVLEALYQAFFTLSLGTGVIVALGSYLPARAPVVRLASAVLALDVAAALAAAFLLAVFAHDTQTLLAGGLEGLFVALPVALGGRWPQTLIYLLIVLVTLTAAVGLFEPVVRLLQCRLRISRLRASLYAGVGVWIAGLLGLLSFGALSGISWHDIALFDAMLGLATNVILPAIGLVFCLLLGRVLSLPRMERAWQPQATPVGHLGFVLWHGSLQYPTRVALALVLFYSLGGVAFVQWLWNF